MLRLIAAPVAARPLAAGGLLAFALLSAFVSANAFYGQPGRHPKPMMATRGEAGEPGRPASGEADDDGLMAVPLVREVQTALASTGHYKGELDGRPGRATAAAIRAFQSEHALPVDGEPSPRLLSELRGDGDGARSAEARPAGAERHASLEERIGGGEAAEDGGEGAPAGRPAAVRDPAATGPAAAARTELVRRIQSGLSAAAVATLKADGILGEQTRTAIRTFEARQGLDVTGAPNERVLKRLIKIGAVK